MGAGFYGRGRREDLVGDGFSIEEAGGDAGLFYFSQRQVLPARISATVEGSTPNPLARIKLESLDDLIT